MRHQQEGVLAGALAAQSDVDGPAAGDGFDDLGSEPDGGKWIGDVPRGPCLAIGQGRVRRVDRWDADQVAERLDDVGVRPLPVVARDRVRRAVGRTHRH